jgi:hypothetical protein
MKNYQYNRLGHSYIRSNLTILANKDKGRFYEEIIDKCSAMK